MTVEQAVLNRMSGLYPELDPDLSAQIAHAAASSVAGRALPEERRELAAHVTAARLAGSHLTRLGRPMLLRAPITIEVTDPAEIALGEHLHAMLEPEELLLASLCGARGLAAAQAATALGLLEHELAELEGSLNRLGAELTLAYHHELICEPASLSSADRPAARTAAVHAHVERCRACRREFGDRVRQVVGQAGVIVPLPPLPAPERRPIPGAVVRPNGIGCRRTVVRRGVPRRRGLTPAPRRAIGGSRGSAVRV